MQENEYSIINRYGDNFTSKTYITNPAIGREEELKKLILVLLTPDKSAILTGKPGIGKTAIVEGLAYKIQKDEVPDALKGYEIVKIDTQALVGTVKDTGDTRVQALIDEIKTKEKNVGSSYTSYFDFYTEFYNELENFYEQAKKTDLDLALDINKGFCTIRNEKCILKISSERLQETYTFIKDDNGLRRIEYISEANDKKVEIVVKLVSKQKEVKTPKDASEYKG